MRHRLPGTLHPARGLSPRAWLAAFLGCGVLGAVLLTWTIPHPKAPWALAYADSALGQGRPDRAVQMYRAIADRNPRRDLRRQAQRRAALVYATHLMQPTTARLELQSLLTTTPEGPERAEILEFIGELLLHEGKPEGAATRFQAAASADPTSPHAGMRLLRAGRTLAQARRDKHADGLLRKVAREHPALRGHAELARAEVKLRRGQIEQALVRFEAAIAATYDPDVLSVARLGRTTCLERLGDLDSALAELEAIDDLDEDVRDKRGASMRSRRWSSMR